MAEAAKLAGLSERTAFRRLSDPKFREQVNSIRRRVFDGAVGRLVEVSGRAVEGLVDLMEGDYPAAQKLAACRAVLEFSAKLRQDGLAHVLRALGEERTLRREEIEDDPIDCSAAVLWMLTRENAYDTSSRLYKWPLDARRTQFLPKLHLWLWLVHTPQ